MYPNQDEKYKKMSDGLKNRIAANYAENDTDYVYIDCFGRSNKHRQNTELKIWLKLKYCRYAADKEALSLTYFPENQGKHSSSLHFCLRQ